jgi:hypothetical protein
MIDAQWLGPSFDKGPKPAVFYFALSANDSLYLDPFNQPAIALENSDLRICSITLPGHDILPKETAMSFWEKEWKAGRHPLELFIQRVCEFIEEHIHKNIITKCGVMGLSRGGYIAAHVAARMPSIQTILGFAPLTELDYLKEWHLSCLNEKLYSKTIRCYIGNQDTRVGTEKTFSWLFNLARVAQEKGIRSPPIEMVMTPSIGREGHGTGPEIFRAGALWLSGRLL